MLRPRQTLVLLAVSWAAIASANAADPEPNTPATTDPKATEPAPGAQKGESDLERRLRIRGNAARRLPEAAPAGDAEPAAVVDLPAELRQGVVADAATRSGIAQSEITVKSAESVTWPDGSLGCPQPGVMYTQMIVPGYRIVLRANDQEYDYRAGQKGSFQLCVPRGGMRPTPLPGNSSR